MSEAYKRDEKVEICGQMGGGCADTAHGGGDGGADDSGRRGGGSGKKGKKGKYQPNGRGCGWAKIKLKWGGVKWLKEHYANMKNDEIMKVLGVKHSTLHRFVRQYGLKKSKEFMQMCQQGACKAARAKGEATNYIANRLGAQRYAAYCKANGIKNNGFKKGQTNVERYGAERWAQIMAKAYATRQKTLERDHRRVALGLEPLSKLVSAAKMTRREVWFRCYMKKHFGYIVRKGDAVIRYDDTTRRCESTEARARELGFAVMHVNAKLTDAAIVQP